MKRIHIVGRKNHGKTTLIVQLIGELMRRGKRVGTIKHTSHQHELDTPGKDSYRHRGAGASPVAIVTPELIGIYEVRSSQDVPYDKLIPQFADCDLVLVEGDANAASGVKIEVWRAEVGGDPLAYTHDDIQVIITDDAISAGVPVWSRSNITETVDRLLDFADHLEIL